MGARRDYYTAFKNGNAVKVSFPSDEPGAYVRLTHHFKLHGKDEVSNHEMYFSEDELKAIFETLAAHYGN